MEQTQATKPMDPTSTVAEPKEKMSKKSIIGMTILTIIALAGVAFGIWGMTEKDRVEKDLTLKITEATGRVTEIVTDKITSIAEDGTVTEIVDAVTGSLYRNPVIKSKDSNKKYSVNYSSSLVYPGQTNDPYTLHITVADGKVSGCNFTTQMNYTTTDCRISGLSGDIYDIVEFGAGHDNGNSQVGFIMTDGRVAYLPLYESVENNNFNIRGTLNIDGYVVNVMEMGEVSVGPASGDGGGYVTTVFVLNDGSYVEYNENMLK